jgi:hypothetical protein
MDPIHGQISYLCCFSNLFKLKLGHNAKMLLVEIKQSPGKEITTDLVRPVKVITLSGVNVGCVQILIIIQRFWKVLKWVEQWRERRIVGKEMIHGLM